MTAAGRRRLGVADHHEAACHALDPVGSRYLP
jgi:hypothetical protein